MRIQKRNVWRGPKLAVSVLAAVFVVSTSIGTTYAVTSSSNNYQITEQQFNAGSGLDSCSAQYCAQVTIGDPSAMPRAGSASFTSGSTSDEPVLEVIIEGGESNLGTLTTEHTGTKIAMVKVRSFQSGGYQLMIMGDPPKFGDHVLSTAETPELSTPGKEQFGINLAQNNLLGAGANPVQVPDDGSIFGTANDNYRIANRFMYQNGDVVAHSLLDSGRTDYTITMVVNISSSTPAGNYKSDFSAIVMPAY